MPTKKLAPKKSAAKVTAHTTTPKPTTPAEPAAADLTKKYRSHKGDTGSTDIQVIGLTEKITSLVDHLASHTHDNDSRRGLLIMVGKRRRLLNYLKRQDEPTYGKLVADLGLRK
jgi:small subunit ribosomal protein S15